MKKKKKRIYQKKNKNEITFKYKVDKSCKELKIFGKKFVENNKNKCIIEYKSDYYSWLKSKDLAENIDTDDLPNDILELTLKNIDKMTDMSYMFDGCKSLLALIDASEWDTSNITNMSYLFNECECLISISDISKWNTSKVTDMSGMFNRCYSLISIPDLSKWDVSNVKSMKYMFSAKEGKIFNYKISSLKSLPDISKWNTSNVIDMS